MDRPEGSGNSRNGIVEAANDHISKEDRLKCMCNCRKTVKVLTIISAVSTIICLCCLFTIIYIMFINSRNFKPIIAHDPIKDETQQVSQGRQTVDDEKTGLNRIHRYIRESNKTNINTDKKDKKKDKKEKRKRKCKCRGRRGKKGKNGPVGAQGPIGVSGPKGDQGPAGPKGEPVNSLMSAHYRSDFQNNEKRMFSGGERCVSVYKSKVCRNRTLIGSSYSNYEFLRPAHWVDEDLGPLKQEPLGIFTVRVSGIYMIYSTTHYFDAKVTLCQIIKINGKTKFRCMDGVDAASHLDTSQNKRHKTCSFSGVTKLEKGDTIEIQNVFADVIIDISKDRTYFGVVLLNPESD